MHCASSAMRGSGYGSGRIWRSSSVGALEARRRQVANDVYALQTQQADVSELRFEAPPPLSRYSAALRKSEAMVCRAELWAQHVVEHGELVARAMDLDRVTADAINESQVLSEASRFARWEKHGLIPPPEGHAPDAWYTRPLPPMSSPSRLHTSAMTFESPRGAWRSELPSSHLNGSVLDTSHSTLGVSLVLDSSRLSYNRLPETSRLSSSRSGPATVPLAWMHERPPSPEPIRPPIYSSSSPRRRQRTDLQSHLPCSPFRPVLPNRSEAGYALESPRQLSPYWQQSSRSGSMLLGSAQPNKRSDFLVLGSTLRGGGINEIRAKRDRLSLEASNSFESPRQSPSRSETVLGPTLLGASMAEIKARRDRLAREVAKLDSNSGFATTWRSIHKFGSDTQLGLGNVTD